MDREMERYQELTEQIQDHLQSIPMQQTHSKSQAKI